MQTKEFLNQFIPENTNIDEKRKLEGFSMFFGYNYENSNFKQLNFSNDPIDLGNIEKSNHFNPTETDNYFTPNLFKNSTLSFRVP